MKSKAYYFSFLLLLLSATGTAQTVSLTFRGETLSEALRQIDHAQDERHILFLPDELDVYTVTAVIDSLPAIDAVRRVCKDRPVSITEVGREIFVEYEPTTVHLRPVVVDGKRVPLPALLLADDVSDSLASVQQLARHMVYFNRLCPQERVYLHFDNTAYFQGETIWYAAYVTDDNGLPEPMSRILYVELLSPTGVILQQQKLRIEHGRCHGAFPLVDLSVKKAIDRRGATNLPSGYYQIRAYTHSMLNFDDAAIFSRVIPVYQFPKQDGHYDNPVVAAYPYHEILRPEPEEKPRGVTVSFYPEGGHLIAGVPCVIAFKATDCNGLGINIDGMRTSSGAPVTLTPQHRGMGRFNWLTQKGGEQVIVSVGKEEYTCTLPKAETRGCALQLIRKDDNLITHIDAVGLNAGTLLAYTLSGRGQVCAFDTLQVSSASGIVSYDRSIPVRHFPTGVYQFTLYNSTGNILAQRMLFIDNGVPTLPVTFTATKPEYRPFERIQMTFQASGGGLTFSLAVRDAADYGTSYRDDIRTYLLLSSELKGLIEDPAWYFEESQQVNRSTGQQVDADHSQSADSWTRRLVDPHQEALDLLMLVQGWTRYDWQRMAGVKPFKVTHYTEQQLVVEGWAFSRLLETPLKNTKIDIRLISPDRDLEQRATVTTDAEGYWSVGLQDFVGKWHLYYHTEQDNLFMKKATTRIRLDRSSKPALYPYAPIETWLPDPTTTNALLPSWREDIEDFVMPRDAVQLEQVDVTAGTLYVDYGTFRAYDTAAACEDIFDEGIYTYQLEDYLYYIGFLEDRYGLAVYPHNVHRYIVRMSDEIVLDTFNWRTREKDLEFFKSVMVYDTIKGDPRIIPSFKRYTDRCMNEGEYLKFMEWMERGDMFIIAEVDYGTNANFSDRRGRNYRLTTFDGYSHVAEFYAPTYPDGPIQGDKDYRRTLYWNPSVTTDADGRAIVSFYNNGYSRALTVSAQGLTSDGIPIIDSRSDTK